MTIDYRDFPTPLGTLRITTNGKALTGCYFAGQKYFPTPTTAWREARESALLDAAQSAIDAYFRSGRLDHHIEMAPLGTGFQQQVWQALRQIPDGATRSYSEIASQLGRPAAIRAVAAAIGRNPISLLIPCHRVIGKNRSLTGYAGGIDRKRALLQLEGAL